jgi:tRNA threonylcarbamoyladenosine biosynthesis protein TsaB
MPSSVVRILALETSGMAGSVAALAGEHLLAHIELDPQRRSAQTLAACIHEVLRQANWRPNEVETVVVAVGPGSFTGLRVGVTSAKVFAYSMNAKVIGVDTLDVLAEPLLETLPSGVDRLALGLDAQRGDVFAAEYMRDLQTWRRMGPTEIVTQASWLASLGAGSAVAGPVLNKLVDRVPQGTLILPRAQWTPQADAVGRLAARRAAAGDYDDVWKLAPAYLRRSAAEDKMSGAG